MNNIIKFPKNGKRTPEDVVGDFDFKLKMLEEEVLHLSKLVNRLIYELRKERNVSDSD